MFTVRAYQRAARTIDHLPVELSRMVQDGENLREIPGIGEAISQKIQELVKTGNLEYYEGLKGEFPEGILTLMDVPGIGPKTSAPDKPGTWHIDRRCSGAGDFRRQAGGPSTPWKEDGGEHRPPHCLPAHQGHSRAPGSRSAGFGSRSQRPP